MSCKRKVESFSPVEIKITFIDKKTVCEIENTAICIVKQKLDKLNIILKNLNVFCHNNILLVNDRYGVCKDLEEVAVAFGLNVKVVTCGLRGKSYILQDKLIDLIKALNAEFSIADYSNNQISADLISVIEKNKLREIAEPEVLDILNKIKMKGYYSINGAQKVTTVFYDGRIIEQNLGEIVSDEAKISSRLKNFMTKAKSAINQANENLRDGTVKLIYNRARQMGYSVREERNGRQVQLVVERCE